MTTWLAAVLLHFLWQGFLIGAATGVALACTQNSRTRYAVSIAGLVAMATAPAVTAIWFLSSSSVASGSFVPGSANPALAQGVVSLWLSGVSVLSLRSVGQALVLYRLRSQAMASPPALQARFDALAARLLPGRTVELGLVSSKWGAMASGVFRPMVLLPVTALQSLDLDQLEAVLAHELAHIRRHDPAVNLLQIALETALFYHPMVWWLSSVVRHERERCCDDDAVEAIGCRFRYVRALTALQASRTTFVPAHNGGDLRSRVERLLGVPAASQRERRTPYIVVGATMLASAVAIAAVDDSPTIRVDQTQADEAYVEMTPQGLRLELGDHMVMVPAPESGMATVEIHTRDAQGMDAEHHLSLQLPAVPTAPVPPRAAKAPARRRATKAPRSPKAPAAPTPPSWSGGALAVPHAPSQITRGTQILPQGTLTWELRVGSGGAWPDADFDAFMQQGERELQAMMAQMQQDLNRDLAQMQRQGVWTLQHNPQDFSRQMAQFQAEMTAFQAEMDAMRDDMLQNLARNKTHKGK